MASPLERNSEVVPDGWSLKTIRELCQILSGGTPSKSNTSFWRGNIPWVSGKDMKSPRLYDSIDHIDEAGLSAGSRLAPTGAVFLLVRGMGLAKDLPVAVAKCPMAFNQDIKALIPHSGISGAFLRAAIYQRRDQLLSRIVPSAHGTMTLNLDDVENFSVPLPIRSEEADVIGSVLDFVQDAIDQTDRESKCAVAFKRASMQALFTRGLRGEVQKESDIGLVPESWHAAAIGDVALSTQYGLSVRGQGTGAYPILRMNCQEDGKVRYRNLQFVDLDGASFEAFRLNPGDLLFNRTNSIELVGRMAIVEDDRPAVFASYLVRLSIDALRCLPRFLNYFMNWPTTQSEIKKLASRAVGQANINASKLRTVQFPLPPLDEQHEIVAILDAIDRKIDLHRRKRAVLDELFKALLHKLMTGEIRVADLDLSALGASGAAAVAA
jgi:type I restriction enzyme S subunit